ncbi:MAG: hypothetical protein ACFFDC_09330 [Promethearchaeota archaeon]
MKFNLKKFCQSLAFNDFSLNQEFLNTLEEMYSSSDILERDYSTIRNIFQDKKLTWNEIDQLNHFLTISIPNSWNERWTNLESAIGYFKLSQFIIFEHVQYIKDIHLRSIPDGYESDKNFHYFLNGQKLSSFIQEFRKFIDVDEKLYLNSKEPLPIKTMLEEFFQKLGNLAEITPPYLLITSNGKENDPMHPLRIAEELRQLGADIKNSFKRLPTKELVSLSNAAIMGLNEFMKGKKLQEDEFKAESFWGRKKGIPPIHHLFRFLEDMFDFEDYIWFQKMML